MITPSRPFADWHCLVLVLGSETMPPGVVTKRYDFRYHTKQLDFDHVWLLFLLQKTRRAMAAAQQKGKNAAQQKGKNAAGAEKEVAELLTELNGLGSEMNSAGEPVVKIILRMSCIFRSASPVLFCRKSNKRAAQHFIFLWQ
jgi:hypothetical protein